MEVKPTGPAKSRPEVRAGVQAPKLLDRVRAEIRVRHYSRRTEDAYVFWIRRYIRFNDLRHPQDLDERDIGRFVTWLAVERKVSASTQNQALSAVLFLYKAVLGRELGTIVRTPARTPLRVPVVLSVAEVRSVLAALGGVP